LFGYKYLNALTVFKNNFAAFYKNKWFLDFPYYVLRVDNTTSKILLTNR